MKLEVMETFDTSTTKILMYGRAGCGKSGLLMQASGGYVFDFDNGLQRLIRLEDKFKSLRMKTEFDTYKDQNPAEPTGWIDAKQKMLSMCNDAARGTLKYDLVGVDSLTGMAEAITNQVMKNCNKPLGIPTLHDWGSIVGELENALKILTSMRAAVIVTAHEIEYDIDGCIELRILSAGRKLPPKIPAMFDEVLHCGVQTNTNDPEATPFYMISGKSTGAIMTSSRYGFNQLLAHNEMGLKGVLKRLGMDYPVKGQEITVTSK